jgi:uncharacterized protein
VRGQSSARRQLRTVMWRRNDIESLEFCTLAGQDDQFVIAGTVVLEIDGQPVKCDYDLTCSNDWRTRSVSVRVQWNGEARVLELAADGHGGWFRGDDELTDVRGLIDVDISVSPSTNTLPIRRCALQPGESAETTAVWIRVPDLSVQPLPQEYTRLGENTYRYASRGGSFTAELTVDDLGLVRTYGQYWERVANSQSTT